MKATRMIVGILSLGACSAQSPAVRTPAEFRALSAEDRAGKLNPGDAALDFNLKIRHSEKTVKLSSYRNKLPVALIFGSYT